MQIHSPNPPAGSRKPAVPSNSAETFVDDVPVLAFGAGLTALGVLRSLHQSDITVYSVSPPDDLVTHSRWFQAIPGYTGPIPEPDQLPHFLERIPIKRAVLIACSDDWAKAIADLPLEFQDRFPASIPELKVVETMTDKWRFSTLIDCLDLPRPKTIRVDSMPELLSVPESEFEGMFLKPIDSQDFSRRNHAKAFKVANKQHALQIMQQILDSGGCGFPILLQEYVPGGADSYYLVDGFVDRRGSTRAWIARRRLTQYPPDFGNSSRSQTIPLSQVEGAVESLEKIWAAVRYRGIFDAEFKYDARDGQFKIIEINARPWWFVEFATRCNVDLCRMAYLDALELPVPISSDFHVGRTCVHLTYDLAAHMGGRFTLAKFWRWLRSSRHVEDIIYRWDDPWPALCAMFSTLRRRGVRGLMTPALPVREQSPQIQAR